MKHQANVLAHASHPYPCSYPCSCCLCLSHSSTSQCPLLLCSPPPLHSLSPPSPPLPPPASVMGPRVGKGLRVTRRGTRKLTRGHRGHEAPDAARQVHTCGGAFIRNNNNHIYWGNNSVPSNAVAPTGVVVPKYGPQPAQFTLSTTIVNNTYSVGQL